MKLSEKTSWTPQNFDHNANGPVPMVRALAQSLNLATVHIGMDIGVDKVADQFYATGLGAETRSESRHIAGCSQRNTH